MENKILINIEIPKPLFKENEVIPAITLEEVAFLTDTSAKYARGKASVKIIKQVNAIRERYKMHKLFI